MSLPLEDYALIGDRHATALVGRDGSIDWFCAPRPDSEACFAALLGEPRHGRWLVGPAEPSRRSRRAYRPGTLVLDTVHELAGGVLTVTDGMPLHDGSSRIVRVATCTEGRARLRVELRARFEYGRVRPAIRRVDGGIALVASPAALRLRSDVRLDEADGTLSGEVSLAAGERVAFVLSHHASHAPAPPDVDPLGALAAAEADWRAWAARNAYEGPWREQVVRSMLTVRALTWAPSGAMAAAPTMALPERLGGVRNWDYRFTWLRDATFTFYALLHCGYRDEARAWRDWLVRAGAGDPGHLQTLFGVGGERHTSEWNVDWLPGYGGASPVRVGNGAFDQNQHDVPGEAVDCLHSAAAEFGDDAGWPLERAIADETSRRWKEPDDGIWEMRSDPRHYVSSRVMSWVALDRAIRDAEARREAVPQGWRAARDEVHAEVLRRGFHPGRQAFTMAYDLEALDASTLLVPIVGFLPPRDPRVTATIEAIRRDLTAGGLVLRYPTEEVDDGLPAGEGAFLPCTLWLADALALQGRRDEARALLDRVVALANDVGLLSEEYDVGAQRLVGNFPQALTHIALVNTAWNLSSRGGAAQSRSGRSADANARGAAEEGGTPGDATR